MSEASRPRVLRHARGLLALGERPLVMGIVNTTPDSFSDGGRNLLPQDAIATARAMAAAGADILDIGGESTRPGHVPVGPDAEWARVAPALAAVLAEPGCPPVSIDTWRAATAGRALAAGAVIVNDVWGFGRDPEIAAVAAAGGAAAVLMHNRDSIDPAIDIVDDILRSLDRSLALARRAGLGDDQVAVDPGIGFGKTYAQSFAALAALPRLRAEFGRPVLLGLSRKGFIGSLSAPAAPPGERLGGTVAGNVLGVLAGADIVRVHDVAEHVQAMRLVEALQAAAAAIQAAGAQAAGAAARAERNTA